MQRSIFLVLLLLIMSGCGSWNEKSKETFSGTIEINEHVLGAKVAGRIISLNVDEGSEVKKGDVLATLDRYNQLKKDFNRSSELLKAGGANQQAVEYAQLAVDDQSIISPVNGVVLVKVHDPGEIVGAGSAVVVVGDRSHYWVRIFVPQRIINRVRIGSAATVKLDGLSQEFPGHVSFVSSQAEFTPRNVQTAEERIVQTFAVKVEIDNPPDYLRPGVSCDVTIAISKDS